MSDTFGSAGSVYVELGAKLDGLARDMHTAEAQCRTAGDKAARAFSEQFSTGSARAFTSSAVSQIVSGLGVSYGIAETSRSLKECVQNAIEAQSAIGKLTTALGFIGAGNQSDAMNAFAESVMRVTTLDDEAIRSVMALGASMGKLSGQDLQDATRAAIGLSEKLQVDLSTAMHLVVKASQGHTETLARVGVVVDENASAQEKYNQILQQGADAFRLAEQRAQGYGGQIKQISRNWGEIKENIGNALLPKPEVMSWWANLTRVFSQYGKMGVVGSALAGTWLPSPTLDANPSGVPKAKHVVPPGANQAAPDAAKAAQDAKLNEAIDARVREMRQLRLFGQEAADRAKVDAEAAAMTQAGRDPVLVERLRREGHLKIDQDAAKRRIELEEDINQRIIELSGDRWEAERAQIDATYRKMKEAAGNNADLLARASGFRDQAISESHRQALERSRKATDEHDAERERKTMTRRATAGRAEDDVMRASLGPLDFERFQLNKIIDGWKRGQGPMAGLNQAQMGRWQNAMFGDIDRREAAGLKERIAPIVSRIADQHNAALSALPHVAGSFNWGGSLYGNVRRVNTQGRMPGPMSMDQAQTYQEINILMKIEAILNERLPRVANMQPRQIVHRR